MRELEYSLYNDTYAKSYLEYRKSLDMAGIQFAKDFFLMLIKKFEEEENIKRTSMERVHISFDKLRYGTYDITAIYLYKFNQYLSDYIQEHTNITKEHLSAITDIFNRKYRHIDAFTNEGVVEGIPIYLKFSPLCKELEIRINDNDASKDYCGYIRIKQWDTTHVQIYAYYPFELKLDADRLSKYVQVYRSIMQVVFMDISNIDYLDMSDMTPDPKKSKKQEEIERREFEMFKTIFGHIK